MNFLTESNLPFRASQRLSAINVSEILKISSLTNEMKRQGRDVIDLSVGEPDFSTPDHIKYASRTRFIPESLLPLFERTSWPPVGAAAAHSASEGPRIDIGARMRGMWR